jgi:hypothetical protein
MSWRRRASVFSLSPAITTVTDASLRVEATTGSSMRSASVSARLIATDGSRCKSRSFARSSLSLLPGDGEPPSDVHVARDKHSATITAPKSAEVVLRRRLLSDGLIASS